MIPSEMPCHISILIFFIC